MVRHRCVSSRSNACGGGGRAAGSGAPEVWARGSGPGAGAGAGAVGSDAAAAAAGWKRRGHAWCGARARRFFGGLASDGRIVRWLPADGSDGALFHLRHDDGDEEDLEAEEARSP